MTPAASTGASGRSRIAICGGGVGAVEAVLALRAMLGLAPAIDLIAPNRRFIHQPLAVAEPFDLAHTRGFDLAAFAREYDAQLHVATLQAVEPDHRRIVIGGESKLSYDRLIVAVGARRCAWLPGALQFTGAADVAAFRELLARLESGQLTRVAFAAPTGASWTLPLYELALLTASWVADRHMTEIELSIVTPEREPLASFGPAASRAMRGVLSDRGIRLHVDDPAKSVQAGTLQLASGASLVADRVVALPRLEGPRLAGLPTDSSGFIRVDEHARVVGLDDVYAAGDATDFPVKQGGITTQQVDAAVEAIAASLGAGLAPSPFQPVLQGMLLTGVAPTYLRAAVSEEPPRRGELAADPLWWPPTKIAGRYLGPYLARAGDRPQAAQPDRRASAVDAKEAQAGHREARELALTFALADANTDDYESALRWLEVVEQLDGALPPGFETKRAQWRERADR